MDIFLIIVGVLLLIIGIIGCVAPGIPGVPLSYAALLVLQITSYGNFTWQFLVIWAAVTILVTILDFIVPAWGTKKLGGSKAGTWGATIGLVVGLFLGIWGIVLGPFLGAVVGELIAGRKTGTALKAGLGSFLGLLCSTVLKLVCCGFMAYYFIAQIA